MAASNRSNSVKPLFVGAMCVALLWMSFFSHVYAASDYSHGIYGSGVYGTGEVDAAASSSAAATTGASPSGGSRGSPGSMEAKIREAGRIFLMNYEKDVGHQAADPDYWETWLPDGQNFEVSGLQLKNGKFVWNKILYRDIIPDAWYVPYIMFVITEDIAQGYRDQQGNLIGEFGVGSPVTRAEALKMALEAAGKYPNAAAKPVPRNTSARETWAAAYVSVAEFLHLDVFTPTTDVHVPATRGEVIHMLVEILDLTTGDDVATFSDVPENHPYRHAIDIAAAIGLIEGDRGPDNQLLNTFRPNEKINRAETAKLIAIARVMQMK